MPASWLPLLAFTAGATLVVAGVAAIWWPLGLIVAGVVLAVSVLDFGPPPPPSPSGDER